MSFEEFLKQQQLREETVGAYINRVEEYKDWYKNKYGSDLRELYEKDTDEYMDYLLEKKQLSQSTIRLKFAALAKYNRYLISEGIQKRDITSSFKINTLHRTGSVEKVISNMPTKEEIEQFAHIIFEEEGIRNYALVMLLASTGVRLQEALNIKVSDLDFITGELKVVQYKLAMESKDNKIRSIFLNQTLLNIIKKYLEQRSSSSQYLFVSKKNDNLEGSTINRMFNKHSNEITPKTLRRFYIDNIHSTAIPINEIED